MPEDDRLTSRPTTRGDDDGIPGSGPLPLAALLGRTQLLYVAEFEELLTEAGYPDLALAHGANVLRHLSRSETVPMRALTERGMVSKQAVSQQVAHLVARGYVETAPDPADHRSKSLRLTPKGQACLQTYHSGFAELERRWCERYGAAEMTALRSALEHIQQRDT